MIKKLADHYFPGPQHAEDHQQLLVEWQKAKYDLLQWKENDLPQAIHLGEGTITATDWCLSKLMQPPYRFHYPMLSFIAEVCLSCPVSNAWPERGASVLKWQNRLWSRIKNDLLNPSLHVSINGPKQQSKELPSLIRDVIAEWLKEEIEESLKSFLPSQLLWPHLPCQVEQQYQTIHHHLMKPLHKIWICHPPRKLMIHKASIVNQT